MDPTLQSSKRNPAPRGRAVCPTATDAAVANGGSADPAATAPTDIPPAGYTSGDPALGLRPGDLAPDFSATTQTGETISLIGLRGRYVVLYFYPRDITPGCTLEACGFRDRWQTLQAAGAVVLGVSADTVASHQRFARLFKLPFPLLADPERQIIRAYRAQTTNPLLGWLGLGTRRTTYLIGPDGRILEVWPRVKAAGHATEVLAALERHQARSEPA